MSLQDTLKRLEKDEEEDEEPVEMMELEDDLPPLLENTIKPPVADIRSPSPSPNHEISSSNEENTLSMIKLFQKNHIRHLFRFSTDQEKDKNMSYNEYPKKTDKCCVICQRPITGLPIFTPLKFDKFRKVYVLIKEPHCSLEHCKSSILMGGRSNVAQQTALLSHFARNFLGLPDCKTISTIPLSAMKKCSDFGYLTEEEYYEKLSQVNVTILEPPAIFVETGLQEVDIKKREMQRKMNFDRIHSLRAGPQQQAKYKETIERIITEKNQQTDQPKEPLAREYKPAKSTRGRGRGMGPPNNVNPLTRVPPKKK